MATPEELYDDAMFDFSTANYEQAMAKLRAILEQDPAHFDAQLSLGMAYFRLGNYPAAIVEGHKAEKLRPKEQLVHTNLSLFYMRNGDKQTAEHHGLQARIASWREPGSPADPAGKAREMEPAKAGPPQARLPDKFPEMPWKKTPPVPRSSPSSTQSS